MSLLEDFREFLISYQDDVGNYGSRRIQKDLVRMDNLLNERNYLELTLSKKEQYWMLRTSLSERIAENLIKQFQKSKRKAAKLTTEGYYHLLDLFYEIEDEVRDRQVGKEFAKESSCWCAEKRPRIILQDHPALHLPRMRVRLLRLKRLLSTISFPRGDFYTSRFFLLMDLSLNLR